ncbi:MAG: hypothetical protein U0414_31025 [Polyangiaceae bacterium]
MSHRTGLTIGFAAALGALLLPTPAEAQSWRKGFHVGLDGAIAFSSDPERTFKLGADADMVVQPSFVMSYRIGPLADFQTHLGLAIRWPLGEKMVALGGAVEPGFLFHFGPTYTFALRTLVTASARTDDGAFLIGFEGQVSPAGFDFGRHGGHHLEVYGLVGFQSGVKSSAPIGFVGGGGIRYGGLFL